METQTTQPMGTNWPGTRGGLIESIAVVSALAWTANTDAEYLHWDNRRAELEKYAGCITDAEMATITRISIAKQDAYNSLRSDD